MSQVAPAGRVLVVAGAAADSDELLDALLRYSAGETVELTLVVVASGDADSPSAERGAAAEAARRRLRGALARFRAAGLYVREAGVGEGGPLLAVAEALAAGEFDEVFVATPLRRFQRLLGAVGPRSSLAESIREATGLPVTHVRGRAGARRRRSERRRPGRPERTAGRSRRKAPRGGGERLPGPAAPERPSAAWLRSREPRPPLSKGDLIRLNLARGLALLGFTLLSLSLIGATNG